jgi:DNA polymerase III gamma/tau subunit
VHPVLEGIIKRKRLASAYLFFGPLNSRKSEEALAFADRLLCQKTDCLKVSPDGSSIKIEQVRGITQMVRFGPHQSDYLVVIVEGADAMTPEAAAAFLKTLEEPPPRVIFILLVERLERIPATIVSRCQKIIFGEGEFSWQPGTEYAPFYDDLKNIRRKSILELFELSSRLNRKDVETLLYDLVFYARQELGNLKLVRVLLDSIKDLKKKANLKITLDVLCLKLSEA